MPALHNSTLRRVRGTCNYARKQLMTVNFSDNVLTVRSTYAAASRLGGTATLCGSGIRFRREDCMPWKEQRGGGSRHFDYLPVGCWTSPKTRAEQAEIAAVFLAPPADVKAAAGWVALVHALPMAMRTALHAELLAGNQLNDISMSGWPNEASIIVTMRKRFTVARRSPPPEVKWAAMHAPQYWREELVQWVEGQAHLAIT